jgi:hypothetical protein
MSLEHVFKTTVESAGGVFVAMRDGAVYFQAAPGAPTISLYCHACDLTNVKLAIKGFREQLSLDRWESLV